MSHADAVAVLGPLPSDDGSLAVLLVTVVDVCRWKQEQLRYRFTVRVSASRARAAIAGKQTRPIPIAMTDRASISCVPAVFSMMVRCSQEQGEVLEGRLGPRTQLMVGSDILSGSNPDCFTHIVCALID